MPEPAQMQIGDPEWNRLIIDGAETLGIRVSGFQAAQFGAHIRELLLWNRKTNVTAITDPLEAAVKHVLDSLAVSKWVPPEATLLDVGAGGGFPGIPLKILMPNLPVTLIDSSRKKNSFQRHVIRKLGLVDITARQIRIEALSADPDCCHAFSVIVCRAFTDLARFVEMAMPLLAPSGAILAMKGRVNSDELAAVSDIVSRKACGFNVRTFSYTLPVIRAERYVYMLQSASPMQSEGTCSPAA